MTGPKWRALADRLESEIRGGKLAPGDRLPSLGEWALQGYSQTTVLRVYRLLAERGLVELLPGTGTFVTDPGRADPVAALAARVDALETEVAELKRARDRD